jgi:hypothetical protein
MVQHGYHGDAESLLWRGDPAEPTAALLASGRLVAMLTVDRPATCSRLAASSPPLTR